jgi:hypothetical protein
MTSVALTHYLAGMIAMGFAVGVCFFLKFYARTRDGLFLAFAAAFALMALNQTLVALLGVPKEEQNSIYLLRLAAFVLIIVAVLHKNLKGRADR